MLGHHRCMGFSLVAVSGSYSLAVVHRLLIVVASPDVEQALGCMSFSSWGMWTQTLEFPGSRAQAQ